ncbi:response regulator [Desulfopila sp. IMCC35008]|uniref:response regulator n=1 Tax=Desulfopila sp. IMCC35008 TaxID=2653858 RepID=UPI0013D37C1C|nr:response regulator [Desulfopila sp. IMCC35008]
MRNNSKKILIVEDEALVGMMLARMVESHGFCVCDVVGTGEEAVAAYHSHDPGVILMDVSLGGSMDGIDAGREIRLTSEVPIVFFTGYYRDQNLLKRAEDIRPLAVLDKLGAIDELVAILDSAFPLPDSFA